MDYIALNAEIRSGPLTATLASFVAAGNDAAIAEALNAKTIATVARSRIISARGVLSDYPAGPMAAAAVLDKLEAAAPSIPALRWAVGFLKGEGLDIGHPATQGMLDQLAAGGVITATEAANLKSLGLVQQSRAEIICGRAVQITDIAAALRNDDGSSK